MSRKAVNPLATPNVTLPMYILPSTYATTLVVLNTTPRVVVGLSLSEIPHPTSHKHVVAREGCMWDSLPEIPHPTSHKHVVAREGCMWDSLPEIPHPTSHKLLSEGWGGPHLSLCPPLSLCVFGLRVSCGILKRAWVLKKGLHLKGLPFIKRACFFFKKKRTKNNAFFEKSGGGSLAPSPLVWRGSSLAWGGMGGGGGGGHVLSPCLHLALYRNLFLVLESFLLF